MNNDERTIKLTNPVFVLDNDKTELMNDPQYAQKGHRVYVQALQLANCFVKLGAEYMYMGERKI